MVKITFELISRCCQFINAVKEYQIDFRGYKLNSIENLHITNDQFTCIDLSDNSISRIEILPQLTHLRTLLFINNRISQIDRDFAINCPNLENLILSNNKISSFKQIDNLSTCKNIVRLSLKDNLISKQTNYRLYVIYKMPWLRVLDFCQVKESERKKAVQMFSGKNVEDIINENIDYNENDELTLKNTKD